MYIWEGSWQRVMKEKDFCTEVKNSLVAAGHWATKIPDWPVAMSGDRSRARFNPTKPCDIIAGIHGRLVPIECKFKRKLQAFSLRDMRRDQVAAFDDLVARGYRPFVFLNIRAKGMNRCYVFPWYEIRKRGKTFTAADLEARPFIQGKKSRFDLAFVFDNIKNLPHPDPAAGPNTSRDAQPPRFTLDEEDGE